MRCRLKMGHDDDNVRDSEVSRCKVEVNFPRLEPLTARLHACNAWAGYLTVARIARSQLLAAPVCYVYVLLNVMDLASPTSSRGLETFYYQAVMLIVYIVSKAGSP